MQPTTEECREYLEKRGTVFNGSVEEMMGAARQLMRKDKMKDPYEKSKRCFFVDQHITLASFNTKLDMIKDEGAPINSTYASILCKIDDIEDVFVVKRHQVGQYGQQVCKGQLENGTCKECRMVGLAGEYDYFFKIKVVNLEGEKPAVNNFMVCSKGGQALFRRSAEEVAKMSEDDQIICAGAWCGYPIHIKVSVLYNNLNNYTSVFAWNFKKMPPLPQADPPQTPPGSRQKRARHAQQGSSNEDRK